MKYRYGPVGGSVYCQQCGWTSESYKNLQALAKIHAMKKGHDVTGELVIAIGYFGNGSGK